jgi:N-methylhydantoinase B/oxoprolinase/acetone carboxylase alpha subunit
MLSTLNGTFKCCVCVQVAANTKGIQLVQELIAEHSLEVVQAYMAFIQANAGKVVCQHQCCEVIGDSTGTCFAYLAAV